jgi:hypothetical protein
MTKKEITKEAKRIKKLYLKETGQTFPLKTFIEQVIEHEKIFNEK